MKKIIIILWALHSFIAWSQGYIYWAQSGVNPMILRCDLSGTNVIILIDSGLFLPRGLEIDTANEKIYWTDIGTKKIQRADLDGGNVQDLVSTGLDKPYDIALDIQGDKIYWTDYGTRKIQRANLNGSNVEDLIINGLNKPLGIDIDTTEGKIYWIDNGNTNTPKMWWANLDGTNSEVIFSQIMNYAFETPNGISLDTYCKKAYWTEDHKVWKNDTLGNSVGNLTTIASTVAGILYPEFIDIDIGDQIVYVSDSVNNLIQRIDLMNLMNVTHLNATNPQGISVIGEIPIGMDTKKEYYEGITLYPNPSEKGDINLVINNNAGLQGNISIYDCVGRLIKTQMVTLKEGNNDFSLNTERLKSGTYIMQLQTKSRIYRSKLVVL